MKISVTDSQGKVMEVGTYETEAAGGEVYGQLLVKDVKYLFLQLEDFVGLKQNCVRKFCCYNWV